MLCFKYCNFENVTGVKKYFPAIVGNFSCILGLDLLRNPLAELATFAVSSGEERSGDFAQLTKQSVPSFSHIRGRPCHGPIAIIFVLDFSTYIDPFIANRYSLSF